MALLALLVCAVSVAPAFAKDDWIRVQSQNFSFIGNSSDKEIRRVATKFEQFREVFKTLFPRLKFTTAVPTTVIVFKSGKSFTPYKPINASGKTTKWIAGYFQSGEDANYIVLTTEGESEETYRTVFHEYVHFLVNNSFGRSRIPPWFNEGIAEYYERFTIEDDQKVYLGNLTDSHLISLQQTKLIPFETFFNIDYYSLHQQGGHGANIFYAQSWAFVHYLMHGNRGARRGQLQAFLNEVISGVKPKEAFEKTFQTDFATMEKELKKYVEQRQFVGTRVTLTNKLIFDTGMTSRPATEADAQATLGDLLFHTDRLTDAEAHLNGALSLDPNLSFAQTSLALVKMRQKKFPEAKQLLEKALEKETNNHLVYYRYAYILSRESMDENNYFRGFPDDSTVKMRASLRRAIELKPEFPESYGLLSFISVVRNDEIDESIKYITTALKLSPGNEDYILNLAALYSRKELFNEAKSYADAVFQSSTEPSTRARAQSILRNIESFRQYSEARKAAGDRQGVISGERRMIITSDKPLTEEDIEKLRAKAQAEAMNDALRKPKDEEKRVLATLSKIECGSGSITYTANQGTQVLKFTSKDFQGLHLMTFVASFDGEFGCKGFAKEFSAVLTYVPKEDPKKKTLGELVAIEIVPDDYKLPE